MFYALIEDGIVADYPLSEMDIRQLFPNTSFPTPFVPPADYEPVQPTEAPDCAWDEDLERLTPVQGEDLLWYEVWGIVKVSPEEAESRTTSESAAVRSERNRKLYECDWTQLSDVNVDKPRWGAYRQALRDVPQQSGFPWTLTWPESPA